MTCESVEASREPAPRDVTRVAASEREPGGGEPSLISVSARLGELSGLPETSAWAFWTEGVSWPHLTHLGRSSRLDAEESARVQRDPDSSQRDPEAGPASRDTFSREAGPKGGRCRVCRAGWGCRTAAFLCGSGRTVVDLRAACGGEVQPGSLPALDGAEFTFWGRPVDLVAGGAGDSYQPESGHLSVHCAQILFRDIPPLVFLTC